MTRRQFIFLVIQSIISMFSMFFRYKVFLPVVKDQEDVEDQIIRKQGLVFPMTFPFTLGVKK